MSVLLSVALLAPPTCAPEALAKVEEALAQAPAKRAHALALQGVSEACALPPKLAAGVRGVAAAPPDQVALLEARCITQATDLWTQACPAGVKVFAQLASAAPDGRPALVHAACQLDRFGLTLAQLQGGDVSPLGVMLAAVVHGPGRAALVQALVLSPRPEATP